MKKARRCQASACRRRGTLDWRFAEVGANRVGVLPWRATRERWLYWISGNREV